MALVIFMLISTIGDDLIRPRFIAIENNIVYNLYAFVELPVCVLILYQFHYRKIGIPILMLCGLLFYSVITYEIMEHGITKSFYLSNFAASFFEILISIYTLYDLLENGEDLLILRSSPFWFATGFLLYNAGTIFLFLILNQLYKIDPSLAGIAFNVLNSTFTILFFIFLAISILCLKPKTRSLSSFS